MRSVRGCSLLCLVVVGLGLALGAACGSDAKPATAVTCQDIRACFFMCGDQACIDKCVAMGTTAGKAAFQTLTACTAQHCAGGASSCPCDQQCYAEGLCLAETEACVGAATDNVCDNFCH